MGGPLDATFSMNNGIGAFKAFEDLTVGRTKNLGTLQVTKSGDEIRLACVNHGFFGGKMKVTENSMNDLRHYFKVAVRNELEKDFDQMIARSKVQLSDDEKEPLLRKMGAVMVAFDECISVTGADRKNGEFTRADIKQIIQNVKELRDSLSIEALQRIPENQLIHLSDSKLRRAYKLQADAFKGLSDVRAKVLGALQKSNVSGSIEKMQNAMEKLIGIFPETTDAKKIEKYNQALKDSGITAFKISHKMVSCLSRQDAKFKEPKIDMEISNANGVKDDLIKLLQNLPEIVDKGLDSGYDSTDAKRAQEALKAFRKAVIKGNVLTIATTGSEGVQMKDMYAGAKQTPEPMAQLKRLARYVEGPSGGGGYLGIDDMGRFAKFLVNENESYDVNKLTDADKKIINDATTALRGRILEIAKDLSAERKGRITLLLPSDEIAANGLKAFITRETVAEVIDVIAEELRDKKGQSFTWEEVKSTSPLKNTTLEKAFRLEAHRKGAAVRGVAKVRELAVANMTEFLNDEDEQTKLKDEERCIVTSHDIAIDADDDVTHACKDYPLQEVNAGSTATAAEILKKIPDAKVTILGYGDDRYCGCYWANSICGTQEEQVLHDLDPSLIGWFKAHQKVNELEKNMYEYVGNPGERYSPMDGIHIQTKLLSADHKPLESAKDVGLMLGALPSLTTEDNSQDLLGNFDNLIRCLAKFQGDETTLELLEDIKDPNSEGYDAAVKKLDNAFKFVETCRAKLTALKFKKNDKDFIAAMKMMMFATKDLGIDVFSANTDQEAAKLVDLVKNRNKGANVQKFADLTATAHTNYISSIKQTFKQMIVMERELGTTHFVIGPIGCGVFANDVKDVAECFAEIALRHGGKMKFVFPVYNGNVNDNVKAFRKAFGDKARQLSLNVPDANFTSITSAEEERLAEAPVNINSGLETDIPVKELGGTGGWGEYNIMEPDEDSKLAGDIEEHLKNLPPKTLTNHLDGYAYVLNLLSKNLTYLKSAGDKERTAYLNFLQSANGILGKRLTRKAMRDNLEEALKPGNLSEIKDRIKTAFNAIDKYLAAQEKNPDEVPDENTKGEEEISTKVSQPNPETVQQPKPKS